MRTSPLCLVALTCAIGCARSAVAPAIATQESPAAGVGGAAHVAWANMSRGQRIDAMVKTVLPRMKAEFVAFDGKRFGRMSCATCHGEGVAAGAFAMPNPALPKLSAADTFARHRMLTPEISRFMLEKVEPDMAALLELSPYDPATHQGFGCFACHTRDGAAEVPAPPLPAEPLR